MTNQGRKFNYSDKKLSGIICLFCLLLMPAASQADDEQVVTEESIELLKTFGTQSKLSTNELNEQRAKANLEIHQVTINDQELNGVVSNNTAINNQTGDNIVSDSAFTDVAGFVSTVQNSGNNVLIQNSTIINVSIDP